MNEPYPGYTCITDEQYKLVAEAGKLPKDQSVELKKRLSQKTPERCNDCAHKKEPIKFLQAGSSG